MKQNRTAGRVLAALISLVLLAALPAIAISGDSESSSVASDVELEAELLHHGTEFGDADFRVQDGRMTLDVDASDLEDLGLMEGNMLDIFVAGEFVTSVALDGGGGVSFDVQLDTDNGDTVPDVMDGDMIKVKYLGVPVLKGTFMAEDVEEVEEVEEDEE